MQKRLYSIGLMITLSMAVLFMAGFGSEQRPLNVEYTQLTADAKKQVDCLADNIYYEAGHETTKGQVAVALVTLNRTQDERFPKDICSVVKQKVKSTCQFSWFCEGKKQVSNTYVYKQARDVALYVYANYEKMHDFTSGALYYHADYVNPRWKLEKTTTIGRHIFYKERDGI